MSELAHRPQRQAGRSVGRGVWYGLYAEAGSGGKAAIFKGNIQVKSQATDLVVAEIGKG